MDHDSTATSMALRALRNTAEVAERRYRAEPTLENCERWRTALKAFAKILNHGEAPAKEKKPGA